MRRLFRQIRLWLFSSINETDAVAIARENCTLKAESFSVYRSLPPHFHIYNLPEEPCWFIRAPWSDDMDGCMIRSSRLIVISKQTGKVLYDGSANDEG